MAEAGEETIIVRRRRWGRVASLVTLGFILILMVIIAVVWIERRDIATEYLRREFERRGVQASYHLDRVGFRTQEVHDLVIGDPRRPDLTARHAIIQMRLKWDGSFEVYRVFARGVRLRGKLVRGKVSWGQIDKLLPPPSGKPFRLPDLTVDLKDGQIALGSKYGRMGFAIEGRGNLSGGFKGKLAASSPGLALGACRLDRFRALANIGVVARRPQVDGPFTAAALNCPASDLHLASPRMEIDSSFAEGFDSFNGGGRLTLATFEAGANGLAGVVSNLTFRGTPARALGRIELAARQARLDRIVAGRTRFDGRYRLEAAAGRLVAVGDYGASSVSVQQSLFSMLAPVRYW